MITEYQQDQGSLYALGALPEAQQAAFDLELHESGELREMVSGLQSAVVALALTVPPVTLPPTLKSKVMTHIRAIASPRVSAAGPEPSVPSAISGLTFLAGASGKPWKELPIKGAFIKLLAVERDRGYAVLMGKLEPGVRYPAHVNVGPEDFYILSGDLHIGDTRLDAGDFHHADGGSEHPENHSQGGCTLLAVLTTEDPLVAYALA